MGQSCNNADENIYENVGEHVELIDNSAPDDVEPNENVPPTEFEQPRADPKPKGKKTQ